LVLEFAGVAVHHHIDGVHVVGSGS
jgi:hypothetical protein